MPMYNGMMPQPYYGAYPQQPWPMPQQQMQGNQDQKNQIEGVRWVSCQQEVDGTSLPFGKKALFMSSASDEFWIKSIGEDGVPTTRHFRYEEVVPPNPDSFITREEFDQRIAEAMTKWEEQQNAKFNIPAAGIATQATQLDATGSNVPFVQGQPAAGQGAVLPNGVPAGMDSGTTQYVS